MTATENKEEEDGFDNFLSTLGYGRWQLPSLFCVILIGMQLPVHLVGFPLLSGTMYFRCYPETAPLDDTLYSATIGVTGGPVEDLTYNTNNSTEGYYNDRCLTTDNSTVGTVAILETSPTSPNPTRHRTDLPSCPIIEYDQTVFTATVISDWDLVCESESWQPMFQTIYNIGGIFGSTIGGQIGDRWGRKRAVQVMCTVNIVVVLGMALMNNYGFVLFTRLVTGCTTMGMLVPGWSLALELTPSKHRSLVGMLLGLPYSVFVIVFAGVAYNIRIWRYLLLVCASPAIVLLPFTFFMDESARWLVQQGRLEQSMTVLEKGVKQNKVKLSTSLASIVDKLVEGTSSSDSDAKTEEKTLKSRMRETLHEASLYLRTPAMLTILLSTPLLWFIHSCLYLGVAINANNFNSDDPFLYVALTGVMDGAAILMITPLVNRIGRRVMVWAGLFVGGILFLLDLLVPKDQYWAKLVMVMVGFCLVAGSFQVNYVYGPELFPTEFRTRGFAFVTLCGSIGFACAPIVITILAQQEWWAGTVTFGCAGIVGSLLVIFLPETRNIPLPETLQDVQERHRKAKLKSTTKGTENMGYRNDSDNAV